MWFIDELGGNYFFFFVEDKFQLKDEDIFTHCRVAKIFWDKNHFKLEDYIKMHMYLCTCTHEYICFLI